MASDLEWSKVWQTAEDHPYIVGGSILALVLILYYAYTVYGSSASTSNSAGSGVYAYTADPNLAADQADQAISQNQTNAAVSENATNASTAAAINSQNVGGSVTENAADNAATTMYYSSALQATQNTNATAITLAGLQNQATDSTLAAELGAVQSNNATSDALGLISQVNQAAADGNVGLAWQELSTAGLFGGAPPVIGATTSAGGSIAYPGGLSAFAGGGAVTGAGALDVYSAGGTYNPATGLRTYGLAPGATVAAAPHYVGTGLTSAAAAKL